MARKKAFACFVTVSATAVILSCSCRKSESAAAWWQRENERLELAHTLALKEYRYQQSGLDQLAKLEKVRASVDFAKKQLKELSHKKTSLGAEISSMESQLAVIRVDFVQKQRQAALGKKFREFSVADGRKFKEASVASIDDAGVTIRHEDGSARLGYEDLDEDQRQFFGLDAESSQAAKEEEKRQAIAYEQWIDSAVAVNRVKEERALAAEKREEIEAIQRRSALAANLTASASARPLAQPARSFGSGYSSNYSTYYSRPRYRYIYYYTPSRYNTYGSGCSYYPRAPYRPPVTTGYGQTNFKSFSNTTIQDIP